MHQFCSRIQQRAGLFQYILGLLVGLFAKHSERDVRVAESGTGKKKFPPQLIIHSAMIVRVYTTDGKRQLPRKQNFRLDDLPPRTPNPADADEIFQRVNSTAMGRKNFAGVIDVQTNADINGVWCRIRLGSHDQ